jgi:hypothetical protein
MLNKAVPFSIGIAIVACTSSLRRAIIMPKTLKRGPSVGRHHKKANTKKTSSEVEGSLSGMVESRANKKGCGAAEDQALVQYHCRILADLAKYSYFIAK